MIDINKIREPLRSKIKIIYPEQYINVFVGFKFIPRYYEQSIITNFGGKSIDIFHRIPAISAYIPAKAILLLTEIPDIIYIEEVGIANIMVFESDKYKYNEYLNYNEYQNKYLNKIGYLAQTIPWGIERIQAPQVHSQGNKGQGIKVCIMDTGIDYNHEDLKENYKGGYNFVANNNDPFDDNGHGTHTSGIVAAMDNNLGIIGVAPEAYLYSVKVLGSNGSGSYTNIIKGIQWAIDNNMNIISMSLAGSSFSQTWKDICDVAYNSGILLVAAAGNNGIGSSCIERKISTPCPVPDCTLNNVCYPALFDSVVAVSAIDSNNLMACFSSRGPKVEVCAPGVSILSTVPKGTCTFCDSTGYKQLSGTSMACPHASGLAALILKANPNYTNIQLRNCISSTSIDLGNAGIDWCYGYGLINAPNAVKCGITEGCITPFIRMTIPT